MLLLAAAPSALAQASRVAEIATYQGPDREQRLIEGAKKEKELTFYSSMPPEDIALLVGAFDSKYGVKVKVWRADSESVMQRVLKEAKARRSEVDIMSGSSSALEPLARDDLLQEVRSPLLADLVPEALSPHGQWTAVFLNTIVQAYNVNAVAKERLPTTWKDLLRPEWRDRLAIEAEDYDWFAQVVMDLGEVQGLRLFREIVAANGISVRKGHNVLANLVAAGEVPFALTVYGFLAEQGKRKGLPIDSWCDTACDRPRLRCGTGEDRPASPCRGAVLRFPDRRGAAHARQPPVRHGQPQDRESAAQCLAPADRSGEDARPGPQVAGAVPEDHCRSVALAHVPCATSMHSIIFFPGASTS